MSQLIRWGLNEPVSHFAIILDDKIVFQSNFFGTRLCWKKKFLNHSTIVFKKELSLSSEQEEAVYNELVLLDGHPYDFLALFYFIWRGFLWRFLGLQFPKSNLLGQKTAFLCTELAKSLTSALKIELPDNLDMLSPYRLYLLFENENGNNERKTQ